MANELWATIKSEVSEQISDEPLLIYYFSKKILKHDSLDSAISDLLSIKLSTAEVSTEALRQLFDEALRDDHTIAEAIANDLIATRQRDPAVKDYATPLLNFKGFQALQAHRVGHWLWNHKRYNLALFLQSRVSEVFCVDIHPAVKIGSGILVDHATGIVIGETSVLEDNISILQAVTLGGTGKEIGDRHPKIRSGVLIGAGASIIGNVEIGEGAKIGAGSVVLSNVAAHTTVAGVPAVVVGKLLEDHPALDMNHNLDLGE